MNDLTSYPAANATAGAPSHQQHSVDSLPNSVNKPGMQQDINGSVHMPVGALQGPFGPISSEMVGFANMGVTRSPPKNKNTAHVPCKFFLQGQCQAGRMCPFSHDAESTTRPAPCKYFAKGACKFGRKCALLHITPDGTITNRAQSFAGPPFSPPPQGQPGTFAQQSFQPAPPGLLSMKAQGLESRPNGDLPQDLDNYQFGARNGYELPPVDMIYTSASPTFGSPTRDTRFGGSPPRQGLSVLDAPLPNSFDSNGISMAARNGPYAASMPSRFGVESPPSSFPRKSQLVNTALRDLHNSAFGDRGMDGVLAGSSPPSGPDEPLTFPKRPLHSDRLRAPRQQMISASLGTKLPTQSFEYSDDDEDREENLLPASLRDLIPDSRTRTGSRSRTEEENIPASFLAAQRRTISAHGTPSDSKVGSPGASSSPSRYHNVFTRDRMARPDAAESGAPHTVGSPLRNSGFIFSAPNTPSSTNARTINGDLSPPYLNSPPRQASMSMLTQGLQRTKIDTARSQTAAAAATTTGMVRSLSNGSTPGRSSLDRAVGGTSVGRERIEEEQDLFDMDEVGAGDSLSRTAPEIVPNGKQGSGAWGGKPSPGSGEPTFGAIGGHRGTPK